MECEVTRLCSRDGEVAGGEQTPSSVALNLLPANLNRIEILKHCPEAVSPIGVGRR